MMLALFCTPADIYNSDIIQRNVNKAGNKGRQHDVIVSCATSFKIKTEKIVEFFGVRLKFISLIIIENHICSRGYVTRENIAFYDHSWN